MHIINSKVWFFKYTNLDKIFKSNMKSADIILFWIYLYYDILNVSNRKNMCNVDQKKVLEDNFQSSLVSQNHENIVASCMSFTSFIRKRCWRKMQSEKNKQKSKLTPIYLQCWYYISKFSKYNAKVSGTMTQEKVLLLID